LLALVLAALLIPRVRRLTAPSFPTLAATLAVLVGPLR